MQLPLAGFSVSQCIVDFAFTLLLTDPSSPARFRSGALLRIEVPFECTIDSTTAQCAPERDVTSVAPALRLFGRMIENAQADGDGNLHIDFSDHASLHVHADPQFESWSLNIEGGDLVVAGPGGNLMVFPALDRS